MIFDVVVMMEREEKWPLQRRERVRVEVNAWGRWGPVEAVATARVVGKVWDRYTVGARILTHSGRCAGGGGGVTPIADEKPSWFFRL